jgi:cytochrome c-type biogenesis protein CcmE
MNTGQQKNGHDGARRRRSAQRVRVMMIFGGLAVLGLAVTLMLTALRDNMVFFQSPSDLVENGYPANRIRIGGMVRSGSVNRDGLTIRFDVTDFAHDVSVEYTGMLPDLFREGQGVVAEGAFTPSGVFVADTILAKHDETYMPPEVADALQRAEERPSPATTPDAISAPQGRQ